MSKEKTMTVAIPAEAKELGALVRAVDVANPTREDRQALKRYFADNPNIADALGNLVHLAQGNLISHSFSTRSIQVAIVAKLEHMRADMGFDKAGAVERSLIEHVCLCWLRLYDCELRYQMAFQGDLTKAQGKYWEGRLSANQRRFLRSVETLERVRRLMRPDKSPIMTMLLKQQLNL